MTSSSSLCFTTSTSTLSRRGVTSLLGLVFVAGLLLGIASDWATAAETETPAAAQTAPAPAAVHPAAVSDAEKAAREAWRLQMVHAPREKGSCYTATYPDTTWHEVPCKPAPDRRFPPRPGPLGPRRERQSGLCRSAGEYNRPCGRLLRHRQHVERGDRGGGHRWVERRQPVLAPAQLRLH